MRVGQIFRRFERYYNDPEYKKKRVELRRKYQRENREKIKEKYKEFTNKLNLFRNKKCKLCGKLLNYLTKGNYCKECRYSNPFLRKRKSKNLNILINLT